MPRNWLYRNLCTLLYALSYELAGVGSIDPNRAEEFASDLLKELGTTLDGTEIFSEGSDRGYALKIVQRYDGLKIPTNVITIDFGAARTWISIGSWNDNFSEMSLYDRELAYQNGKEFAIRYDQLSGSDCDESFYDSSENHFYSMKMLQGRPVYRGEVARCQIPYMDGHYHWFEVYVDAINGRPLYVMNLPVY